MMKRFCCGIIIGAAALAFSAAGVDAQTIGFKLGASMSKLTSSDVSADSDNTTGFAGGGFIRFGFGRLGIQPEILSIAKGGDFDDIEGEDFGLSLEYVAIPVLLHLPLTYGSTFAPYVFGGPEFAFEVGCDVSIGGAEADCDDGDVFSRKSTDIGLSAGGGLAFAMGPGALLLEGRYTWGLTNINDTEGAPDIKNRSALFLAGYAIPIGRRY